MDVPIGALGDGFEDRLVLESRSEFSIWSGWLLYLLTVPIFALVSLVMAVGILDYFFGIRRGGGEWVWLLAPILFVLGVRAVYRDYRSRDFAEICLEGTRLDVDGRSLEVSELVDVKVWNGLLCLRSGSGELFQVHGMGNEKALRVLEHLQQLRASEAVGCLRSGREVVLEQRWSALAEPAFRGLCLALPSWALLRQLNGLAAVAVAVLVFWLVFGHALRLCRGGGMILSGSGVRKAGGEEVPWTEVVDCWAGAYYQDALVVHTRRGQFRLLSETNPAVWALVIRDLKK